MNNNSASNARAVTMFGWLSDACAAMDISVSLFNMSFHDGFIECVTATEHVDEIYCENMGAELYDEEQTMKYVESVQNQIRWAKSKEEK